MPTGNSAHPARRELLVILLAGFAGGLAELAWISLYAAAEHISGWTIAREVAASFIPMARGTALAPALGVVFHFALSIVLTGLFALVFWKPVLRALGRGGLVVAALAVLTAVWAINFLVILPHLNANFLALVPLSVALMSKLLFGLAIGFVLADPLATRDFYADPVSSRHAASA